MFEGRTLGTPIAMLVRNEDARPAAYDADEGRLPARRTRTTPTRRSTASATTGRAAGARARARRSAASRPARSRASCSRRVAGVEVLAWVAQVHDIEAKVDADARDARAGRGDARALPGPRGRGAHDRTPSTRRGARGDSLGGVVECVARGVPAGLGEPVFDKLEADLAKAMLSLPAAKGFEIGSGFARHAADRAASTTTPFVPGADGRAAHRDAIAPAASRAASATARTSCCAWRSSRPRRSALDAGDRRPRRQRRRRSRRGRHDPCVLPRAVPMVEAMVLLVLADPLAAAEGGATRCAKVGLACSAAALRPRPASALCRRFDGFLGNSGFRVGDRTLD